MKSSKFVLALFVAAALAAGCTSIKTETALPSDKVRPATDVARDKKQRAEDLSTFSGASKGSVVADFIPGGGYWTRLFSSVVGPHGRVFALIPTAESQSHDDLMIAEAIANNPQYSNVLVIASDFEAFDVPQDVEVFWSSRNFRDLYAHGRASARSVSQAIYNCIAPGGTLVVVDHVAPSGMPIAQQVSLGRIDPFVVREDLEAAGFVFDKESTILSNPADNHTLIIIDPAIAGKTDQFVYRFRKPG